MNKARNFSTSLFADTACAIVGIELDVTGEEHIWADRPCVFLFNHQSQADVIVMPALLRRDLAAVGKKEIGDVPVIGTLMKLGGTVLIDRENSRSAHAAMEPLVDVMLKEGRSVCIAPEGTRSTSTNLGRFKKGAFHLAMQAGVPIVPIVIHNAIDVAARGENILRPATVKVAVLPAVDTSQWSLDTIDEHVSYVRDMFLDELDQAGYQNREAPKLREVKSPRQKPKKKKVRANVVKLASGAAKNLVGKASKAKKKTANRKAKADKTKASNTKAGNTKARKSKAGKGNASTSKAKKSTTRKNRAIELKSSTVRQAKKKALKKNKIS